MCQGISQMAICSKYAFQSCGVFGFSHFLWSHSSSLSSKLKFSENKNVPSVNAATEKFTSWSLNIVSLNFLDNKNTQPQSDVLTFPNHRISITELLIFLGRAKSHQMMTIMLYIEFCIKNSNRIRNTQSRLFYTSGGGGRVRDVSCGWKNVPLSLFCVMRFTKMQIER